MLDVLIIGGGPIGLACGIAAQKENLDYLIIEKGCLVNSLYNYPVSMTFFSTSELLEIGGVPFISHNPKPTRSEALEYYRRVQQSWNLSIKLYEPVLAVNPLGSQQGFNITTAHATYQAQKIVVATGFYDFPKMMGVEGESLPKVKHYYDDPHLYAGRQVLVVGAANSAIDVALETYRKGAKVTLVARSSEISQRVKYWIRPDIENRIKEGSIDAYFNSKIHKITPTTVEIDTPEGIVTVPNEHVLAMTGYQPDFQLLRKMGIDLAADESKKPSYDEDTHETNVKGLYLAGVVCGGMHTSKWFIENSRVHAQTIMEHIAEKKLKATASAVSN